jgi:hypothetical protein
MPSRQVSHRTGRCAVVLWGVLSAFRAGAAEPESVRIEYVAPVGCPDAAAFLGSLRERTTRFRPAPPDEPARSFTVRVTPSGSSYAGQLEIRSLSGSVAVRTVDAKSCDQVTSALALITALAISPNALTDGPKPTGDAFPSKASDSGAEADRKRPPSSLETVAPKPAAQEASQPWLWSAGLLGSLAKVAPDLGYGGEIFVQTEAPISSQLGPSARLGAFFNQSRATFVAPVGASATFQWVGGLLEGCPVRLTGWDMRFAVIPCVAFRLGALRAQGRGMSQPRDAASLWSDVGLVLRLRLAVTARLSLEAQGSFIFPLTRPSFEIMDLVSHTPTADYSTSRLGGSAAVGAAYRFR